MAEKFPYLFNEPATLLYSSITQKSAPPGTNAEPRYSATFGVGKVDFDNLLPIMVQAITSECGAFSGNPQEYYLACMSGKMAAGRVRQKAALDAQSAKNKGEADKAFKITEKAEKRATEYEKHAGILTAASKFEIELAYLMAGKVIDINTDDAAAMALAGKEKFFPGSKVVPKIAIQGFLRKKLDDKDGCTAFLQNCLFIAKGPRIDLGGGGPSNQEVYGGFAGYSDYDPTAMAPDGDDGMGSMGGNAGVTSKPSEPETSPGAKNPPPPPPSKVDPNRPTDPTWIHDNGDGTELWYVNGEWDEGHPIPKKGPPPPPNKPGNAGQTTETSSASDQPMW